MIQPEINYGRFRRLFSRKRRNVTTVKALSPPLLLPETAALDDAAAESAEDLEERAKVRRIQQALRTRHRVVRELMKLDAATFLPLPYDFAVRVGALAATVCLVVVSLAELCYGLFVFEVRQSDPLDPLREVSCDATLSCSMPANVDLDPPSALHPLAAIVTGLAAVVACLRHLVGLNSTIVAATVLGATALSHAWISYRSHVHATTRVPL